MIPVRTSLGAVVAVLVLLGATACAADDEPEVSPAPTTPPAASPCLVSADELTDLTGTPQEVREVELPDGGLGTELFCETVLDERDVSMEWKLREPGVDPPPSLEEQRTLIDDPGMTPEEVDLGGGFSGWAASGRPIGLAEAQVVALLDDLMLHVTVTAHDDDSGLGPADVEDEALGLARAVVAARQD